MNIITIPMLLFSQETQRVECRRRNSMGTWETTIYETGDRVILQSINLELAIADLYRLTTIF